MSLTQQIWVVIPAAGIGSRMGSDVPKQYLLLNDQTVIEYTISVFDSHPSVSGIVVAISKDDEVWPSLGFNFKKPLHQAEGGEERCFSVLNALKFLKNAV